LDRTGPIILVAHAAGKTVSITGMNTCNRWGDGEDVNLIKIKKTIDNKA
jgi:hypothetical protein